MKIPSWIKVILWAVVIGFFSWLLSQRYAFIINGTATNSDIIILLIWIALIAAFIFQEVDFFGVRLKREIDNLRTEFKEQFINLRTDIQNNVNLSIYLPSQPSDSKLKESRESLEPTLKKTLTATKEEIQVPEEAKTFFNLRYALENELRRIVNPSPFYPENWRYPSISVMAEVLLQQGKINSNLHNAIRDVNGILTAGIHGRPISNEAREFVFDITPRLIQIIRNIQPLER